MNENEELNQPIEEECRDGNRIMHEDDPGVAERYVKFPSEEDHGISSDERNDDSEPIPSE